LQTNNGAGFALGAFTIWGFAPVYFMWVDFAAPLEVLAHRIVWAIPLLLCLITITRQWPAARQLDRRQISVLALCSLLLATNWLIFIFAVQSGRIAETALGYFINPLVSIVLGGLFLNEKLRRWQWVAAAIAALGVSFELLKLGQLPWLALTLAFSFGFYGLLRKQLGLPSSVGLGIETAIVAPVAAGYLIYAYGFTDAVERDLQQTLQLGLGGLVTVAPLVLFASAAIRMPLTTLGFFQYLAPSLSLLLAVFYFEEAVSSARWVSFSLVWFGLVIFSVEGLYVYQQHRARHFPRN